MSSTPVTPRSTSSSYLIRRSDGRSTDYLCLGTTAQKERCHRQIGVRKADWSDSPFRDDGDKSYFAAQTWDRQLQKLETYFCYDHVSQAELMLERLLKTDGFPEHAVKDEDGIPLAALRPLTQCAQASAIAKMMKNADLEYEPSLVQPVALESPKSKDPRRESKSIRRDVSSQTLSPRSKQDASCQAGSPRLKHGLKTHRISVTENPFLDPTGSATLTAPHTTKLAVRTRQPLYQKRSSGFQLNISLSCCIRRDDDGDDVLPPPRVHPMTVAQRYSASSPISSPIIGKSASHPPHRPLPVPIQEIEETPGHQQRTSHSSYVPDTISHKALRKLHDYLARPLTTADCLAGFIYIFWETPPAEEQPSVEDAESLLDAPTSRPSNRQRNAAAVLQRYGSIKREPLTTATTSPPSSKTVHKTIELKIGHSRDVEQRLRQWRADCDKPIKLVRAYPDLPSRWPTPRSPSPSPPPSPTPLYRGDQRATSPPPGSAARVSPTAASADRKCDDERPRMVPFVRRVEKLIHAELADCNVPRQCDGCSREHREWFEIEASRQGIEEVDRVVRKWIQWAEREAARLPRVADAGVEW